jgi:sterol desaturase/sphingolipid hydroxylase (fatty acid hydroxylase superfamily)
LKIGAISIQNQTLELEITMKPQTFQMLCLFGIFSLAIFAEALKGRFLTDRASKQDNRLDLIVTAMFPFINLTVITLSGLLCATLMPTQRGTWADLPIWQMVLILLVVDDMTQYWWHRLSHTSFMWPLHRAHHSAAYMSVRVVYRNNIFYYLMMPGLWLSGVMLYLGFGWVYVIYTIVKVSVIIGAHTAVRWDYYLYKFAATRPLMWVLERTISTPATHYAHHAITQDDGVGHYTGNYGNLLFFWDILFGTARITRQYPAAYGLSDDIEHGSEKWYVQFLYPLFQSKRKDTVLKGMLGSVKAPV